MQVVKENLNPIWDETFDFLVEDGLHDLLILEVWDHDMLKKVSLLHPVDALIVAATWLGYTMLQQLIALLVSVLKSSLALHLVGLDICPLGCL